jgi:organic radical activating enzyme
MLTKTEPVSMDVSMIKDSLPVMEDFYTIQGEGFHQGKAAYFVRLAGCDVGCVWCDVKESWDINKYPSKQMDILRESIGVDDV